MTGRKGPLNSLFAVVCFVCVCVFTGPSLRRPVDFCPVSIPALARARSFSCPRSRPQLSPAHSCACASASASAPPASGSLRDTCGARLAHVRIVPHGAR